MIRAVVIGAGIGGLTTAAFYRVPRSPFDALRAGLGDGSRLGSSSQPRLVDGRRQHFPGQSTAVVALGGLRVAQAILNQIGIKSESYLDV